MARLSIASSFALLLALYSSLITAQIATPVKASCPTITRTTSKPGCPAPTPPFCATPDCILLKSIDVPCGCPTTVPTATLYTPCPSTCIGTCGTAYKTNLLCTKTIPTTTLKTTSKTSISCPTITRTTGLPPPGIICPEIACPVPETPSCIVQKTMTGVCGCSTIHTTYTCPTCPYGCSTIYSTLLPPCAYTSFPVPVATPA